MKEKKTSKNIDKNTLSRKIRYVYIKSFRFVMYDVWRKEAKDMSGIAKFLLAPIKVLYMTISSFIEDNLASKASSLTYSTVLSIVPMLAVLIGIAKGFGLQNIIRDALIEAFPAQHKELEQSFVYVENYLNDVQGGLFIGLGFIVLLYTVLMLISSIEDIFNDIWQASNKRSWTRRIFDYLGLFLLLPIFITISSAINITSQTIKNSVINEYVILGPMMSFVLGLLPYFIIIISFVLIYMALPNVKVKFVPALIAGAISGTAFQIFQMIYISGMLWISKYNAIYGSFAVVPLLLLWLQLSWLITLFGAQMAHSIQNLKSFYYVHSVNNVSRRYKDFVAMVIVSNVCKDFFDPKKTAPNIEELSENNNIPLKLCNIVVNKLIEVGILIKVKPNNKQENEYLQPAVDPKILTVSYLLEVLDRAGVEDLPMDRNQTFSKEWQSLLQSREALYKIELQQPIRDI